MNASIRLSYIGHGQQGDWKASKMLIQLWNTLCLGHGVSSSVHAYECLALAFLLASKARYQHLSACVACATKECKLHGYAVICSLFEYNAWTVHDHNLADQLILMVSKRSCTLHADGCIPLYNPTCRCSRPFNT